MSWRRKNKMSMFRPDLEREMVGFHVRKHRFNWSVTFVANIVDSYGLGHQMRKKAKNQSFVEISPNPRPFPAISRYHLTYPHFHHIPPIHDITRLFHPIAAIPLTTLYHFPISRFCSQLPSPVNPIPPPTPLHSPEDVKTRYVFVLLVTPRLRPRPHFCHVDYSMAISAMPKP